MKYTQKILIGPIIGLVTSNTARVILEFSEDGVVTASLSSRNNYFIETIKVEKEKVVVFKFEGLQPETEYQFNVEEVNSQIPSKFKTLSDKLTDKPFRVAVCSGNDVVFNTELGENSLYNNLANRATNGQLDLIIHNGNQVYIDHKEQYCNPLHFNVYYYCYNMIKKKNPKDWPKYESQIIKNMKELYRRTWSGKVAEAMANCPNIMQFDEHDIHNNLGYESKYDTPNDCHNFITNCARKVYYEYQRQLREDVDYVHFEGVKSDYFSLVLNNVGFFFLDHRGERANWYNNNDCNLTNDGFGIGYGYNESEKYFGNDQTNHLKNCLNNKFKDCPIVIIISQNPIVLHNEDEAINEKQFEEFIYNDKDKYGEFLRILANHKKQSKQEIFFVSSNINIGGHTEIYKNGFPCFKQIVTSGTGYQTKDSLTKFCNRIIDQRDKNLPKGFSFKHQNWTSNRNYASLNMYMNKDSAIIKSYLTISDNDTQPTKLLTVSNKKYSIKQ